MIVNESFSEVSKALYLLYCQSKSFLCNEGNYKLSSYQHHLSQSMVEHMNNNKKPLLIQTNNNVGTKAAILSASLKYKGTVVIVSSNHLEWQKEISKLYANLMEKDTIFINSYTKSYDPKLMGYKIVIVTKGDIMALSKHSIVIIYKINTVFNKLPKNAILFSGKTKKYQLCDYIEYPQIKPLITKYILFYNDQVQIDRLIDSILLNYQGPYLIIGEKIVTLHPLKEKIKNLRSNDIIFMKFNNLKKVQAKAFLTGNKLPFSTVKTVIVISDQYDLELDQFGNRLNLFIVKNV